MSKLTSHAKLSEIVVEQTRISPAVVDAFIQQLFSDVEKELISKSSIKIEGLGLLRIIKSGGRNRVLYFGSNERINEEIDLSGVYSEPNVDLDIETSEISNTELDIDLSEETTPDNLNFNIEESIEVAYGGHIESFEEKYPQEADIPLPLEAKNSNEKSGSQHDYVYVDNRKMNLIKTCIITLTILLLVSIGYIAIAGASDKPDEKELRENGFQELENTDTLAFNKIVVPKVDVSIQYISRMYYGSDVYWPYLFMANKDAVNQTMVVRGGTRIRIPHVSVDLADLHDGTVLNSVKSLAKDIILVEK